MRRGRQTRCQGDRSLTAPALLPCAEPDASSADFRGLGAQLLAHEGFRTDAVRRLAPEALTAAWLRQGGNFRPVLVPAGPAAAAALGLCLPLPGLLTVEGIARAVGPQAEVTTVDVLSQKAGPRWTLYQWSLYFEARQALHAKVCVGGGSDAAPSSGLEA